MNSICLRRAAGAARILPPRAATNPPKRPTAHGHSVRLTSRTVCSVSARSVTQDVVRPGVTSVRTVVPSIWTS